MSPRQYQQHTTREKESGWSTQEFPYTFKSQTKFADLPILKPGELNYARLIHAAALTILGDPDDTHMYVNKLMKAKERDQIDEKFRFPTAKNPGNEAEHKPIYAANMTRNP